MFVKAELEKLGLSRFKESVGTELIGLDLFTMKQVFPFPLPKPEMTKSEVNRAVKAFDTYVPSLLKSPST